ncbi:MAG: aldo/keto reductase, partial [Planctomycetota bacterium]
MQTRTLGSTGLDVTVVGIGTWQLGGEWGHHYTQPEADAIFDAARACGINFIDTAECYGDHVSERLIGAAVERDRDDWIIATKFGHKYHGFMNRTEPREPADVR